MTSITKGSTVNSVALGQLLVSGGFISDRTLKQALHRQRWNPRPLGAILQKNHKLSHIDTRSVLHLQRQLGQFADAPGKVTPPALHLTLGELLVANGEATREQVDKALAEHRRQRRRLGEVLVDQHILTPSRLCRWLTLQKKLLSAAAMAIGLMSGSVTAAADESSGQRVSATKFVQAGLPGITPAWVQHKPASLARLSIKHRDFSEISRSRDGSLTLKLSRQGLNLTKRF